MKVSILGNGLTSLALAKMLANEGIKVDIFSDKKSHKINEIQTLGISKSNVDFFNKKILNIKKSIWEIKKIEIFCDNLKNEKILNFENNKQTLFSITRNLDLYNNLLLSLNKDKLIKFKKKISHEHLLKRNYNLIFNCDYNNYISKKLFYRKIKKNYDSYAHISTFKHKRLSNNRIAYQVFTKKGPIAFLPISSTQTSIVFSAKGGKDISLNEFIKKYNFKYEILEINKSLSFPLKSSNLRSYYHDNIIAFGDLLHKLHPLAGQGFNMTIRDIKEIYNLIIFKKEHGLDIDKSICSDFEKKTKNRNYLFSQGIDFIYEFFNLENRFNNKTLSTSVQFFGRNQIVKNFLTKFADNGLVN
tara:strand:- start:760 stop:1833 length:1074 start_codon:yes stop_codon:yes gene_type:complete